MKVKVEKNEGTRLDQYLSLTLEESRSKVQNQIREGHVLVNGKKEKSSYLVQLEDEIEVEEVIEESSLTPEDIPLEVVYEDDDLLIINKKSGMVVHPAPGNYHGTLVNALLYRFSLSQKDPMRPGIVHRLDKDTSGLMMVAKSDKMHDILANMIQKKEVKRTYLALVDGIIPHSTGTIDAPIGRDPSNREKMKVTDENSKNAVTHFKVLKRFPKVNQTLIECVLETGRTHQIRVHLSYIGYPIYNDPVYGKRKNTTSFGQFLHSKSIRFIHPFTKKEIFFEVEPPKEFQDYLKGIEE